MLMVVFGTRPEIIKMSPIVNCALSRGIETVMFHSAQHYSENMDKIFLSGLNLPVHKIIFSKYKGSELSRIIMESSNVIREINPGIVLVQGDTNTALATSLAARKLHKFVGHVEAGLRSNDWRMPEEHNRVIIDHISELLFAPTEETAENLRRDNVQGKIVVTGNTIVDMVLEGRKIAEGKSSILKTLEAIPSDYFLVTLHREENVDDPRIMKALTESIKAVAGRFQKKIIFPMHPRTRKRIREFEMEEDLKATPGLRIIDPIGYLDLLRLLEKSALVLTDSGGLQEESCSLKVPCVTLRNNTERPETVEVGANMIAGTSPESVSAAVEKMLSAPHAWPNPLGDGRASERIIDEVQKVLQGDISGLPC
jgi:UDP-N-acetylglucosamine 2-epimerase (non-hydrolysing)